MGGLQIHSNSKTPYTTIQWLYYVRTSKCDASKKKSLGPIFEWKNCGFLERKKMACFKTEFGSERRERERA
jgi:hypothetical protein